MSNNNNNNNDHPVGVAVGVAVALGAAAVYTYHLRSSRGRPPVRDLQGSTVCLTGGNIGIGRAVALQFAERGATVLIGCRNIAQGQQVCHEVTRTTRSSCAVFALDLEHPASIDAFCQSIQNQTKRTGLHLLINNAGAMLNEDQKLTQQDSFDASMAVNHLGWMQLTRSLLPLLEKTKQQQANRNLPIRIVNVGSKLEKTAPLPLDTTSPQQWDHWIRTPPTPYTPFQAYAKAKLAMTAVTLYWANHNNHGIPMLLLSPGMVNTNLPRFMPFWQRALTWPFRSLFLRSPEQAAHTVLYVATSPTAQNGFYYDAQCQPIQTNPQHCSDAATNPDIQTQLWHASWRAIELRAKPPQPQQP